MNSPKNDWSVERNKPRTEKKVAAREFPRQHHRSDVKLKTTHPFRGKFTVSSKKSFFNILGRKSEKTRSRAKKEGGKIGFIFYFEDNM